MAVPPAPEIRSQREMCEHFIPVLKEKGIIINKMGKRMARPAVKGETILTIINGEVVGRKVVTDDTSVVVRQESADHELFCLPQDKFVHNYMLPGTDITETEARFDELRSRGFQYYERKGQSLIYQVTDDDMAFVPVGEFQSSFSQFPQPIRTGDFLVTGYPDCREVYMSRHASIYKDGQFFHGPGVKTAEEMCTIFLPLMRERGMKMRRAGTRLARPAKRGEEVMTIINGEVIAKAIASSDSSMVIQEDSADREFYCLDDDTFRCSYQVPGAEITQKGADYDALRERGFKYFEKTTGGMVLIYQVTEEDMEFVPSGKFAAPFSITPQPLQAGDYLITSFPESKHVYLSRNADQIFFSSKNLEVHYVFGSPLTYAPLNVALELDGLRTSGAVVRLTCATRENLVRLKKAWSGTAPTVLHVSCHTGHDPKAAAGSREVLIVLEDTFGRHNPVSARAFADLVIGGAGLAPQVMVLNSCHSQAIAMACLERGVQRVVAVRAQHALLDRAARDFTLCFYGELRANHSVEAAYRVALENMRASKDPELPAEADKFVLLPEGAPEFHLGAARITRTLSGLDASLEPHLAARVPFGIGEAACVGSLMTPRNLNTIHGPTAASRMAFCCDALKGFSSNRILKICGPSGIGKKAFAGLLASFATMPGGRFFSGGGVVVQHSLDAGIPSQAEMREHFLPVLKKKGTLVQKVGKLLARPAKLGETVRTVIDGEVVAQNVVEDDTSMVIRHDSADHEYYVHDAKRFLKNYDPNGTEIEAQGPEFDALRERGFKFYERKGMALLYQVQEEDMRFVPEGQFHVSFSNVPQPLKVGDYIATGYPNTGNGEVYLSRNATQVYLSKIVRTHEEMRKHFLPIITKRGKIARRVGRWLARPARAEEEVLTSIGGEVVAKTSVPDDTSMIVIAESVDRERYVLDELQFSESYKQPGRRITRKGYDADALRNLGFKYYERKGLVRIYQVTEADLEFVPAGKFWGTRGTVPQPLRVGDYLVTEYPVAREVYASRNAEQVFAPAELTEIIRSQDDMREHFIPLLMEKGIKMRRTGRRAARHAVRDEKIHTIINGEVIAKVTVADNTSMVIRQESCDRELYVRRRKLFHRSFEEPGVEIGEEGAEFDALRDRGYKWYGCKGMVIVHQVHEEDMKFVAGGKFYVSSSSRPQPLKLGDYIVTSYPDAGEVYASRNAMQIYTRVEDGWIPGVSAEGHVVSVDCMVKALQPVDSAGQYKVSIEAGWEGSVLKIDEAGDAYVDFRARCLKLWIRKVDFCHLTLLGVDRSTSAALLRGLTVDFSPTGGASGLLAPPPPGGLQRASSAELLEGPEGLRVRSELETALNAAASKQAALCSRWYNSNDRGPGSPKGPGKRTEAEAAVEAWLRAVPTGSKTLLLLIDGARYLLYDSTRELLRRLLRAHKDLHLLITVERQSDAQGPPLDPLIREHGVVPMRPLEPQEAVEVFLSRLRARPALARRILPQSQAEAMEKIAMSPAFRECQGLPGRLLARAERVDDNAISLDMI